MRNFLLMVLSVLVSASAIAGGKIVGVVKDANATESIIGVTVQLYKAGNATAVLSATTTNIDGKYIFEVEEGKYEVELSSIGYVTKRISDIVVTNNNTTDVSTTLDEPKNNNLNEVVIQATAKKESLNALYSMQKNAIAVSDGIAADVIKKSPDRSTGDALKRVSGTTIQDGKFVIVRGMSDRYNAGLVDDAVLPSTEPNRKAFSFDIIPASMIENIIISKSATPDLPGDFAGGVINILTKEVPDDNFNNISIGTGMNTVSTFKNFHTGAKTTTNYLGFSKAGLPSDFPTTAQINNSKFINPNNPLSSAPYINMLNNDYAITNRKGLPTLNLQASLGRIIRMNNGKRLGITAAVSYNHSENVKPNIIRQYDNYDYQDQSYNFSTNLGALLNLGYYVGNSKISLKTLYNRTFDDNLLERVGTNNSSNRDVRYYAFDLIQKSLFKTTLSGDHKIGGGQSKLGWLLSYNYITNDQPDQRKISYTRASGSNDAYSADITSLGKSNSRLFSNLSESIMNGGLNFSTPINLFEKSSIKIGAFGQYRYRDFANRYLGTTLDNNFPGADLARTRSLDQLYATELVNSGAYNLVDQTNAGADEYTAKASTMGAYAMMDNKFTDKLRLVWGARLESYHINLFTPIKEEVNRTWNDVLPSANLTYALTDKTNLRASYFRSLARPELREMANLGYYDYELSATLLGNPDLQRSQINNFDLRYEWYPKAGEVLSASLFYKGFNNTIENFIYADNSAYEIKTINYDKATNIGVEVEMRKKLDFISDRRLFKNLSFYLNASYIHSKVTVPDSTLFIKGEMVTSRPLAGQSPYVVNVSLGYTSTNGKFSANVLYNTIGQRLYLVGQGRISDVYERPRHLLDFQMSYAVSKRSEFRFAVKDILNNKISFFVDQERDGKFGQSGFENGKINPDKDWILQQYKPGTTFSLTYALKF
jgi:outer membrane receptor protein involved in Fe transport